jgi:hypothetical protein
VTAQLSAAPDLDEAEKAPDGETAFIVIVLPDGTIKATADLETEITVNRVANIGDMRRACSELIFEINNNQSGALAAQGVMQVLEQQVRNAADLSQQEQIRRRLADNGIPIIGGK